MNMLSKLLGKFDDETPFKDLSEEEQAEILAEEKKARIKHHRDNVRNGPVRTNWITPGQQRRAVARARKTESRKATKRHHRNHFEGQMAKAILRAKLQAVGAVPYATQFTPTLAQKVDAAAWLVRRFGERDEWDELIVGDDMVDIAVRHALAEYQGVSA